jgi:hypothetical protein
MTLYPDSCVSRTRLREEEVAWLQERPQAAHEVAPDPYCELERGHPGPHAALGQDADGVALWVRWTLDAVEIVERPPCAAEADSVDELGDRDLCMLFDGHPGRHSFEFEV